MNRQHYPLPLEEYYIRRLRETYRVRARRVAALQTPDDVRRYQKRVRRALRAAFGPLPARSPLNANVWRTSEWGDHRIEHVTFESRPGMLVTANLYLPSSPTAPLPGVLFPCGHSANGKAYPLYAAACVRLARAGYAVLIYDPMSQGERDIYSHVDTGRRLSCHTCCDAHNVMGRQLHAAGEWFGAWRLWDGIRSTDYLAGRPEVDAAKLAVTGQSGGGTLSAFLWAMEPRFSAVASSCWCTSYLNDIENGMPADEEQYPPGFIAAGCDKIDFFTVRAGESALLLGQEQDFFDDRGLKAGYAELRRLHDLVGGDPDLCRLSLDSITHCYSEPAQLAMIAFFNRVFGRPEITSLQPVVERTDAELQVTPEGDVWKAGSRAAPEVASDRIRAVVARRKPVTAHALPEVIRKALCVTSPIPVPHYRRLFHLSEGREATGQHTWRFMVETEPGLCCELRHVCKSDCTPYRLNAEPVTTLYLPDTDSITELNAPATMAGVDAFWTFDARGLGAHLASLKDPYQMYGHDYMAAGHAVLYGESLLGDRVRDVLMTLRLLKTAGGAQTFRLAGRRQGAVTALLTAALDSDITSVACIEAPESFAALATAPFTFWPAANFPHAVLKAFDLPEIRSLLGARLVQDTRADMIEFKP